VKSLIQTISARLGASPHIRDLCCVAIIVALAAVMLHPVLRGDWPVGHDHPVHVVRIAKLEQALRTKGTPWTWSHRWFAGYPLNVTYPVGADLFVLAVRAVSLGALSITQAYAVAFGLFYALYGYAAFYFVRRAFDSRLIALVAAILLLTDAGNSDVGGWFWLVETGVWTAALGFVPALIATAQTAALLERPSGRTAAAVAFCVGLALLCHPIHLIYFGLALPLICGCRFLCADETSWRRALLLLAAAGTCGLLIASFWLVPHFSAGEYILEVGTPGPSLADIGNGIVAGDLFSRMLPLALAFGVVGCLLLLRTRRPLMLFSGAFVFVCLLLSSSSLLQLFGSEIAEQANKRMVFPRFFMLAKPFWYAGAAWLLVNCVRRFWKEEERQGARASPSGARRHIAWAAMLAFACLVVAPILYNAARAFVRNEVRRPAPWHSQREDRAARVALVEWARTEFAQTRGFFRIAHGLGDDGHRLSDLALYLPYPFYKASFTPTGHFKHNIDGSSTAALRAANVRYVLSGKPLDREDLRMITLFAPGLNVYEFTDWNPEPFEVVEGAGEVELIQFTDEEITLHALPGSRGTLRLNVSYFPKWRATRDGAPVPIAPVEQPEIERSGFMEVPLEPGMYRFRYGRDMTDYLGTVLCVLGLTSCGFLAFTSRIPQNRVPGASRD
jgi:hypothetical protein